MFEYDKDFDALTLDLVGLADSCRFRHFGMAHKGRLNLHRPKAVSADFDDVVHATLHAEVAHLIFCRSITRKVHVLDGIPIGLVTIRIAKDSAHRGRPRVAYDQEATSARTDRGAILVNHIGIDSRKRAAGTATLEGQNG